ncbi:IclR family transcriptional regulator [Streptomyces nymphaeiformis]|jgi:IclR family transcriptional regulator, acetate operon repressor|uniref:DNA-binding IclR family transcriptional regulator n=1 Tax=Streptomyces nymphaeiformis TaxID=2663842 RepID=A0A7W7XDB9_9ACTN|nr:IclR family transcriptional regulator C-terminal domain-containing protein [Streptomyces nymphaeiformis]MBB4984559.1 DNA-binding IclR family transcriptional regulator [Streptomyces nymphaeiformis]
MAPTSPTLIGSVRRALVLLELVAEHHELTAKRLARMAGLPLATTYHLLRTLVHDGHLRNERGAFRLGPAAPRLVGQGRRHGARLPEWLRLLATDLDAPVSYAVMEDGEVELVLSVDGPDRPAVQEWAEYRTTAHAHALGQCLLAQLDAGARRAYLARRPVSRLTPRTVPDEEALMRRLAGIRRGAPVVEREEYVLGTVCGAVPIAVGGVRSAVGFSLPVAEEDRLEETALRLRERLERALTAHAFTVLT